MSRKKCEWVTTFLNSKSTIVVKTFFFLISFYEKLRIHLIEEFKKYYLDFFKIHVRKKKYKILFKNLK